MSTQWAILDDYEPSIEYREDSFFRRSWLPDVNELLLSIQELTGTFQKKTLVTTFPATPWFRQRWKQATKENREATWHLLPEDVFDAIDEDGRSLVPEEIYFLALAASSKQIPTVAAAAAIRLMGILAEEDLLPLAEVLPVLLDTLAHEEPQRRYHAVKAIWQANASAAIPALQNVQREDPSETVRSLAARAIAVLK